VPLCRSNLPYAGFLFHSAAQAYMLNIAFTGPLFAVIGVSRKPPT
jgi:hypothetical protein